MKTDKVGDSLGQAQGRALPSPWFHGNLQPLDGRRRNDGKLSRSSPLISDHQRDAHLNPCWQVVRVSTLIDSFTVVQFVREFLSRRRPPVLAVRE